MKNKFFRTFAVTLAAVLCLTAFSTTAFAGGADPDPAPLPEETGTPTTAALSWTPRTPRAATIRPAPPRTPKAPIPATRKAPAQRKP